MRFRLGPRGCRGIVAAPAHVCAIEVDQMVSKAVPRTKSEVLAHIAAETGLHRRQVAWVLDSMNGMIDKSLKREGVFAIPGLVKLKVVKKPATKARKGVNPFTGEPMMFRAKPASKKVKAVALKNLKNMVA